MEKASASEKEIQMMDLYFKGYEIYRSMLRHAFIEGEIFADGAGVDPMGENSMIRAKLFEIRQLVKTMPNGDEKLLIYYHYIRGETVEKCGELMGISRATAFRLKRKALAVAWNTVRSVA